MKYLSFDITNFKGIQHASIKLDGSRGSIYTLVGLNESGKTTILEAINYFRTDDRGVHALAQKSIGGKSFSAIVPKDKKANFNGDIKVSANIKIEEQDIKALEKFCKNKLDSTLEIESFPETITITRNMSYENSAHNKTSTNWDLSFKTKKGKKRTFKDCHGEDWQSVVRFLGNLLPRIVYFPTFLFDFPEKILVSEDGEASSGNEYFKMIIEDALASLDEPLDLETHIINRIARNG